MTIENDGIELGKTETCGKVPAIIAADTCDSVGKVLVAVQIIARPHREVEPVLDN